MRTPRTIPGRKSDPSAGYVMSRPKGGRRPTTSRSRPRSTANWGVQDWRAQSSYRRKARSASGACPSIPSPLCRWCVTNTRINLACSNAYQAPCCLPTTLAYSYRGTSVHKSLGLLCRKESDSINQNRTITQIMNDNGSPIPIMHLPTFDCELLHCHYNLSVNSYKRALVWIFMRDGIEKISRIRKCKGKGLEIWCNVTGGPWMEHRSTAKWTGDRSGPAGLSLVFFSTRIRHSGDSHFIRPLFTSRLRSSRTKSTAH